MAEPRTLNCFACGEENTPDSRFCKFCGRPLLPPEQRPSVVHDPHNRILLVLVMVLLVACMVFGVLGLLSSKVLRQQTLAGAAAGPSASLVAAAAY